MDYLRLPAGREVQGLQAAQALIVSTLDANKQGDVMKLLLNVSLSLIMAAALSSSPGQTLAITVCLSDQFAD